MFPVFVIVDLPVTKLLFLTVEVKIGTASALLKQTTPVFWRGSGGRLAKADQ
jgi:hypothetical protein